MQRVASYGPSSQNNYYSDYDSNYPGGQYNQPPVNYEHGFDRYNDYNNQSHHSIHRPPSNNDLPYRTNSHSQSNISIGRTSDQEALEIGMIISQQESEFGINMYDSLTPADEPEIANLTSQGYTTDEAILMIFNRRYRSRASQNQSYGPPPAPLARRSTAIIGQSQGYNQSYSPPLPPQQNYQSPSSAYNSQQPHSQTTSPV